MLTDDEYFKHRADLQQNLPFLSELERQYMDFLVGVVFLNAAIYEQIGGAGWATEAAHEHQIQHRLDCH